MEWSEGGGAYRGDTWFVGTAREFGVGIVRTMFSRRDDKVGLLLLFFLNEWL